MTPGIRRLVTACSLALVASLPLAALHASAQAPTWPTGLPVTRFGQEGDVVSLEFDVRSPDGEALSFSATGLPPGLQIDPLTGRVHGTLAESDAGTVNTGGSAGIHSNITLTARSLGGQTSTYVFAWHISRFRKGDVFAGIGGGKYNVFSEDGVFKYALTTETAADFIDNTGLGYTWGGGTTTGCGYNWVTRKIYFTAFDDDYDPAFYEVNPVPVGGAFGRSNPIRTFRDSGLEKGLAASNRPIDGAPESVVFGTDFGPDGVLGGGDDRPAIYVGHAGGYYNQNEDPADIDERPVIGSDDGWTTIYYLDASGNFLLDGTGQRIPYPQGTSPDGFLEKWPGAFFRDANGNPIAGLTRHGRDIQKFIANGSGGWVRLAPDASQPLVQGFDTHAGWQGTDWLDLASDQRTLFYTSEWSAIYRYDVGPNPAGSRQLEPFVNLAPRNPANPGPTTMYALRLLPPGDGTGGLMVATPTDLLRFSGDGRLVKLYDSNADGWFALNISPDGRSVWSASTSNGRIYRWDIASGALHDFGGSIGRDGIPTGATQDAFGRYTLDGLCVMAEYTAAQEVCGDGLDNDGDGEIDEICQPIEVCSNLSPGDDDGDGLVDSNDPDCPGTVNVCAASGYTDASIAGFCARKNFEGEQVSIGPAPPSAGDRDEYTITGLPPGITAGPTGILSGVPLHTIVRNGDSPTTRQYTVTFDVVRKRISDGVVIATYRQSFVWTIENVNRPPVPFAATQTIRPGQTATFTVAGQTGGAGTDPCAVDPDCEDTVTLTPVSSPATGTMTVTGPTHAWVAPPTFTGSVTYTYTRSDGRGGTAAVSLTINVVNALPVAVNDTAAARPGQAVTISVLGNDSDPDGDPLTVTTGFTQGTNGTVTKVGNTFVYTPASGFVGTDTFTYTISDGFGGTATATVTITVTNLPPVAVNDSATTAGTRPVTIAVLQNDSDPDSHVISVTGATTPPNGSVVVNTNGSITYTANPGFQGVDTFFYTITDGYGGQSTATVTITVGPPNRFDACLCSTAKASPGEIWPPNHKQTQVVRITNVADPDGGPLMIKVLGIYQDEPTNYLGDGDTTIDAGGVGTSTAWVRAERTGNPNIPGNGRVYEIVFEATAADGSTCTGSVFTGVPHDQGQGNLVIDDGIRYDSTVAGGPIVRTALRVEGGLSDADVTARGFQLRYVAEARIGGAGSTGTANRELIIGSTVGAAGDTADFTWTSGQQAVFVLSKAGNAVEFRLLTSNQSKSVRFNAECANGDCDDIFIRAQSGGTGKITLSSLSLNGRGLSDTLAIPVGGPARSIHLSGLAIGEGMLLTGVAKIEWTSTPPSGDAVNFRIQVGSACPSDAVNGGGGGSTPPLARSDDYATDEDTPLVIETAGILLNDLTFAGPLSAELVSTTSHGTLSLNTNGSFTYTPAPNFNGQDVFRYRVSDGSLSSEPALVTITVNPIVDPPVAIDDTATTNEGTPVSIAVLANDSDPLGGPLALTALTQPANGAARVSSAQVVYSPNPGFLGVDTFTYTVTGSEGSDTATVTVTVVNISEPPVAVDNTYTTAEDTPLDVAAPGVLANDTDPDAGDTLSAILVAGPQNGTLTLSPSGAFVYTPNPNYNGADRYTYRVRDAGGLESNVATVRITITAVNDPPVAVDDSYVVGEDSALQINSPGVKSNDSDPDTAAADLTVSLVTGAQRGSLTLNPNGSFIYTPFPDVTGSDSFTYRVSDGTGSDTAVATIAIPDSLDPPVAVDDSATTQEDTPVTIAVLGNDSDPDTATLTIQGVTPASNGVVAIVGTQVRYTPNQGFNGQDVFTYTITDGQATATATVTVTIAAVNDAPVAVNDAYSTARDTVLNVQSPGLVGNDSDPESGPLTARIVTPPASGSVVLQTSGAFSYTPASGFTGTATFTYRVNDGAADSNIATVTITVTGSNAPPVAASDSYTTEKNVPLTIGAPGILSNDSDPDAGDTITALLISGTPASAGSVALNADGSFTFTPASTYMGTTTFRYRALDGQSAQSNEAVVTIVVKDAVTSGRVCYDGGPSMTQYRAQIDWERLAGGDIRARAVVGRNYADNTYGVNKIGWGSKKRDFKAVYNSDFGQLAFYDADGAKKIDFKIDLLTAMSGTPSGYGTRGVSGGDGAMVSGSASDIVSLDTSMNQNMNAFGYVTPAASHPLKSYSPPTNDAYTPNATYPLWIWDMWYEATVKGSTFGSAGFGSVALRALHASPPKADIASWRLINCQ